MSRRRKRSATSAAQISNSIATLEENDDIWVFRGGKGPFRVPVSQFFGADPATGGSASDAALSAARAEAAAQAAEDTAAGIADVAADAARAEQAADTAEGHATTATTKASEASDSADTAEVHATTATTKASEASTHATTAVISASDASGHADDALEYSTEAGESADISTAKAAEAVATVGNIDALIVQALEAQSAVLILQNTIIAPDGDTFLTSSGGYILRGYPEEAVMLESGGLLFTADADYVVTQ